MAGIGGRKSRFNTGFRNENAAGKRRHSAPQWTLPEYCLCAEFQAFLSVWQRTRLVGGNPRRGRRRRSHRGNRTGWQRPCRGRARCAQPRSPADPFRAPAASLPASDRGATAGRRKRRQTAVTKARMPLHQLGESTSVPTPDSPVIVHRPLMLPSGRIS